METPKRLIIYWWDNFQHAFHGAAKFLHGMLFVVAVVGTISPHFFLTEETMTKYTHKSSIFILIAYLLWIAFYRHEEKEKELEQQKRNSDYELTKLTDKMEQQKAISDGEILKNNIPSLGIHWFPKLPYLRQEQSTSYCLLGVKNTSRTATAQNVKLELLSMIDTLPNPQQPNIAALRLRCTDDTNTINPESTIYFELFLVNCDPFHRTISITDSQKRNYQMEARQFGADMLSEAHLTAAMLTFHSYNLEIKVSATGCSPITQKFTLHFPLKEPYVQLTPVD